MKFLHLFIRRQEEKSVCKFYFKFFKGHRITRTELENGGYMCVIYDISMLCAIRYL